MKQYTMMEALLAIKRILYDLDELTVAEKQILEVFNSTVLED